jgi:hypothetical protein
MSHSSFMKQCSDRNMTKTDLSTVIITRLSKETSHKWQNSIQQTNLHADTAPQIPHVLSLETVRPTLLTADIPTTRYELQNHLSASNKQKQQDWNFIFRKQEEAPSTILIWRVGPVAGSSNTTIVVLDTIDIDKRGKRPEQDPNPDFVIRLGFGRGAVRKQHESGITNVSR